MAEDSASKDKGKKGREYRDLIARYVAANFPALEVYTEVSFGKTIIGKNRKLDIFIRRPVDQSVLGIECKWQEKDGSADEKIHYALHDLEALWFPGCLVYSGEGWSEGVLHTLRAAKRAAYCQPAPGLAQTGATQELDAIIASVFGMWDEYLEPRQHRRVSCDPSLAQARRPPRRSPDGAAVQASDVVPPGLPAKLRGR